MQPAAPRWVPYVLVGACVAIGWLAASRGIGAVVVGPSVAAVLSVVVLARCAPRRSKPLALGAGMLLGEGMYVLLALALAGPGLSLSPWILLGPAVLIGGAAWPSSRAPGLLPVLALAILELVTVVRGFVRLGPAGHRLAEDLAVGEYELASAIVVGIVFKLVAVGALVSGYARFRPQQKTAPEVFLGAP